jgi:hypothetical protein
MNSRLTTINAIRLMLSLLTAGAAVAAQTDAPVVLENTHFQYTISAQGQNLGFVDRASGIDYLKRDTPSPCALVRLQGKEYPATSAALTDGRLTLHFGDTDVKAVLRVDPRPSAIRLVVESTRGPAIEFLTFLNAPLTLQGKPSEPFAACALALNLGTRVDQLPALQTELRAVCYPKFGVVGSQVALVGMPLPEILSALKEVLSTADQMPLCKVAGPWAQETPFAHGSYLFNFGTLTETNVDDWIAMAHKLGMTQIDNHGGGAGFFRFGDFELNRQKWPDGWETYRRIVARLHAAGVGSIFHTYGFFIDKQSKYVTPVPDPRLDAFRTFTLAEAVTPDANEIRVNESTLGMNTVTGFFVQNSVVLHLGDELVAFGGASQEPPWRFSGVKRGALGTRPAAHAKGDQARHLKECFGLFVPNPETDLFTAIAADHAAIVNRSDFDGLYLDAIDGSSILRGEDEAWYWASKFVFEIQKRLKKPAGMEMSAMWHHFWQYRTRWQAWDYPQRGHKRFVDLHADAVNGGLLLPLHFGWWSFQTFDPPLIEPTYPDVMEYLGAKLIGWDAGISLTSAIDRDRLRSVPLFDRAAKILRTSEELRHSGVFDARTKAQLREPGQEFALVTDPAEKPRFCRSHSEPHTAALTEPWALSWQISNPFRAQPARLRIEALMSAVAADDPKAILLADAAAPDTESWKPTSAQGVTFSVTPAAAGASSSARELAALNAGKVRRNAAWAKLEKRFAPPLNLKGQKALAVTIQGDGLGELLAIRQESPQATSFGAVADRYIPIDFTGQRTFTLVETESARWNDYVWNDGKSAYNVYRETIDFGAVESVSLWLQNLPPGQKANCRLGPVKALPMIAGTVNHPKVTINGAAIEFPVAMKSGSWLECNGPDDCVLYGPKGELLGKVTPLGGLPTIQPGSNEVQFSCAGLDSPSPRAKVTVFTHGDPL